MAFNSRFSVQQYITSLVVYQTIAENLSFSQAEALARRTPNSLIKERFWNVEKNRYEIKTVMAKI